MTTLSECVDLCGKWQGGSVQCSGGCPCDPPADAAKCERCVDGSVVAVGSGDCFDGNRVETTCFSCEGTCDENTDCPRGCKCVNGKCVRCVQTCCGECDEENPCPPQCECVDGECVPTVCCLPDPIDPLCPAYLIVHTDNCQGGTSQYAEYLLEFGDTGHSQEISLTGLECCGEGECGVLVRVRSSCAGYYGSGGVDCHFFVEYGDADGNWRSSPIYSQACACTNLLTFTVEQRDEGDCEEGEPEPAGFTRRHCSDSCLTAAECEDAGGCRTVGTTCEEQAANEEACLCEDPCKYYGACATYEWQIETLITPSDGEYHTFSGSATIRCFRNSRTELPTQLMLCGHISQSNDFSPPPAATETNYENYPPNFPPNQEGMWSFAEYGGWPEPTIFFGFAAPISLGGALEFACCDTFFNIAPPEYIYEPGTEDPVPRNGFAQTYVAVPNSDPPTAEYTGSVLMYYENGEPVYQTHVVLRVTLTRTYFRILTLEECECANPLP